MRPTRLAGLLRPRWWLVFVLAGAFFMGFGVGSYSLFRLLQANLSLFVRHGVMVIADGALQQLVELVALGYLSLLLWIGFKSCEHWLVVNLHDTPAAAGEEIDAERVRPAAAGGSDPASAPQAPRTPKPEQENTP